MADSNGTSEGTPLIEQRQDSSGPLSVEDIAMKEIRGNRSTGEDTTHSNGGTTHSNGGTTHSNGGTTQPNGTSSSNETSAAPPTARDTANDDLNRKLRSACDEGDYIAAKKLLEQGADPNYKRLGLAVIYVATNGHHEKIVQLLLDYGANPNILNKNDALAIHLAAANGDLKIVKLLKKCSNCTLMDKLNKNTPMMNACVNGHAKVVEVLLKLKFDKSPVTYSYEVTENGQTVERSRSVLVEAVNRGREDVAMVIVNGLQLKEAFQYTYRTEDNEEMTPLRLLFQKMPVVAELAFNRICSDVSKPETIARDSKDFKVTFHYEYIDDFTEYYDTTQGQGETAPPDTSWMPKTYRRTNHCLHILANSDSKKLLRHPVITTLLHHKWISYAQYLFYFNLLLHLAFAVLLTVFTNITLQPESATCIAVRKNSKINSNSSSTSDVCEDGEAYGGQPYVVGVFGALIIMFAVVRLSYEVFQLYQLRMKYFFDWINYIEVPLFLGSILFTFVFATKCLCPASWQWQIGAVCVFLAWIDLIAFVRMVPIIGIYVVMFGAIVKNFIQVAALAVFLVLSFSFSFYMLFHDPEDEQLNIRTPFQNAGRSFMKTMTMTTGELDFDTLFRQDYTAGPDLQYAVVTYPFWIMFIVLMPILLMNLLTGLAVDDVKEIQENAEISTLKLWVNFVLLFEELLPKRISKRRVHISTLKIHPDEFPNSYPWTRWFWRKALNLSHYDTYNTTVITPDTSKEFKEMQTVMTKLSDTSETKVELMEKKVAEIDEKVVEIEAKIDEIIRLLREK